MIYTITLDPLQNNHQFTLPENTKGCQILSATILVDGLLTVLRKQTHRWNLCNLLFETSIAARVEFLPNTVTLFRVSKISETNPEHHTHPISMELKIFTEESIEDEDLL